MKRAKTGKVQVFKTCPMCGRTWESRESFLEDPELDFNGYQADFSSVEEGIFYFTHENQWCGSTMAIQVSEFLSLYQGARFVEIKQFSDLCSGKCLDPDDLDRCPAECLYAFVREVSQIIKDRFCVAL